MNPLSFLIIYHVFLDKMSDDEAQYPELRGLYYIHEEIGCGGSFSLIFPYICFVLF